MVGAALWRVRGTKSFNIQMVREPQFVRVFLLAVGVHMIWNAPFTMPFYLKYIALGFVAWVVNLGLIQVGLKEIRDAQQQGRAATA
jgi:RsiW-degrading membrane proteinase PrsW (M82 family)